MWLQQEYARHYEPEWKRLAREAPHWPQVREDLADLMAGRLSKHQRERYYDAARLRDIIGALTTGADPTPYVRVVKR
jgi:hypothetical protein